jgi:hypothetical protein
MFENELIRCGPYFGGQDVGFLDLVIYPWIARIGVWSPEFLKGELMRIQSWRRRMKTHSLISSDPLKSSRSDLLKFAKKLRAEGTPKTKITRLNSSGSLISDNGFEM